MGYRGNMKKRMQRANASGAVWAIILGEDELARGEAALRDLRSGEQQAVPLTALVEKLTAI
jgi:histidyl-tRNA synthetase